MADLIVQTDIVILSTRKKVYVFSLKNNGSISLILNIPEVLSVNKKNYSDDSDLTVTSDVSKSGTLLAVCSGKVLQVWKLTDFSLLNSFVIVRSVSKIYFTPSEDEILVADKSGDVYLFSVNKSSDQGNLLLGHLSVILDILLTCDGKYVITCDRDEKIRVSHFPNSYNINNFCLGHTEYVSSLQFLPHNKSILISGSGDGTMRFWEFLNGCEKFFYDLKSLPHTILQMSSDLPSPVPVTNIAGITTGENESVIFVSAGQLQNILVFTAKHKNSQLYVDFHSSVEIPSWPITLKTFDRYLWILLEKGSQLVKVYFWNQDSVLEDSTDKFNHIFSDCKEDIMTYLNDCSKRDNHLYKKKYDNVLEYLEKKKARLLYPKTICS